MNLLCQDWCIEKYYMMNRMKDAGWNMMGFRNGRVSVGQIYVLKMRVEE